MKTVTAVLVLSCASMCSAQTAQDRMVGVGGHQLHVAEAGSGAVTVVFESGLGEEIETWNDVQPKIAEFARTFRYERAGLGKSDMLPASTSARTTRDMAADLYALLRADKVPGPYVLVGHSLGGTIVQVYAHAYPEDVAGLVLVDPEDSQLIDLLHSRMSAADWESRDKAIAAAMSAAPPGIQSEREAAFKTSGADEAQAMPLPDVPVILLTGTKKNPEFPGNPLEQDLKLELQNKLLAKVPHGKHVLAPNSRHYIQNDEPGLVIDAVREIVHSVVSTSSPK